jgi:hypothetical protein
LRALALCAIFRKLRRAYCGSPSRLEVAWRFTVKTVAPLFLLAVLAACASDRNPSGDNLNAASRTNRVSVYVGKRQLDHGDWEPVDEQLAFGLDFAHVPDAIGWEIGLQGSRDSREESGLDIRGEMTEISAGLRVQAGDDVIRPYAGAGVAWLNAEIDADVVDDDDDSFAAYAHAGLTCDMGPSFYIGFDGRIVFGSSLSLLGDDTDADYAQLAVLVGFAF